LTSLTRQQIIDLLRETLLARPEVKAAWLGGSDASGRTDQYSDIDILALVADDAVEMVFTAVANALNSLSPIDRQYRIPEPTWHGHSQTFYRLQNAPPWLLVDFAILKESSPVDKRFLEVERHGRQQILFDREGVIQPAPFDRESHEATMRERLQQLSTRFDMFNIFVDKAIWRGDVVEAVSFYQAMTIRPLVDLLRMRYCPDRFDYGARYLDRDLPADVHEQLKRLMFCRDLEELHENQKTAVALFNNTMAALVHYFSEVSKVNAKGEL
jgi:predicted nucleotidyltransferase